MIYTTTNEMYVLINNSQNLWIDYNTLMILKSCHEVLYKFLGIIKTYKHLAF